MNLTLRNPSVGPIVGHTTSHSSRIWMRASVDSLGDSPGRTVGLAALYDAEGNYVVNSACYLRLHRQYDRTGIVDFTRLKPDTTYSVRVGSLVLDSANLTAILEDIEVFASLPRPEDLRSELEKLPAENCLAKFTTFPLDAKNGLSFIFGSCRYPGLLWPAKKSDIVFGEILKQCRAANAPRFVLMNGDQIYADKLSRRIPLFRADTPEEFQERYLTAFTSPNMRALLRAVPTYMILDDHEIEDDWLAAHMDGNERARTLYQNAIAAYKNYQWIHSPRNYCPRDSLAGVSGDKFYYSFECGGYPFFIVDTRTQRIQNGNGCKLADNHMLGYPSNNAVGEQRVQINILCDWLVAQQKKIGNRPKFIATASIFVPNGLATAGSDARSQRKKCADDSWAAFPETRRQLLQTMVDNNIQNVVFLSGDAHSSCVAEISFTHQTKGQLPLRALSITSSAFYWPWPFADGDPDSFVRDSEKQNDPFEVNAEVVMNYKSRAFVQENNFTRIDIQQDNIVVQNFDSGGRLLGSASVLTLAPD